MKSAWIGNACLATSWLVGLSYYHEADWLVWAALVILGLVCMLWMPLLPVDPKAALISGLLLIPAAVVAPWPHKAGVWLLVLGVGLEGARIGGEMARRLGTAAMTAGSVLIAQSLAIVAHRHLTARFADLPEWLTIFLAVLARFVGMDAVADGPRLVLYTMRETHPVAATWSLLVDPVSLGFMVGGLGMVLLGLGGRAKGNGARESWAELAMALSGCVLAVAAWLPLRVLVLLGLYLHRALRTEYGAELDLVGQFWSPWVHLLLLGPPLMLVWHLPQIRGAVAGMGDASAAGRPGRRWVMAMGMVWIGAVLLTLACCWEPVGARNGGRVLVDDYHSGQSWPMKEYDTTRTDRPFDTRWYGRDSSYNYFCIYDYCSRFYQMSRQTAPLTDAALATCDVLVLKDPSAPYAEAEKAAVRRFLARGGGVLFLGDHTSVFGSGVNLNDIVGEFGFRYRYDCAFGIDSVFDETVELPLVPHPIVQHVETMEFATSCTLEVGASRGRAPMVGTCLKSLGADYHSSNFYPQPRDRPAMRWGAFVQMWATRRGPWRIVAFTDSTIFSNFCVFEPGKSELMLGMIEWLNRANPWAGWRWLLAVSGALGVLGAGTVLGRGSVGLQRSQPDAIKSAGQARLVGAWGSSWPLLLSVGLLGWALGVIGAREMHRRSSPWPHPERPMVMVAMDRTVTDARLPKNGFISGGAAGDASRHGTEFGQLERCILRLGYFFRRAAGEAATEADLIVVPFPNEDDQSLVRAYGERLVAYVREGGRLLVLDSPENLQSRANSLLHEFGLGLRRVESRARGAPQAKRPLTVHESWTAPMVSNALEVTGGTPLAWLDGRPAAAWKSHGQGVVCAVGFGSRFRDDQMGPGADVEPRGEFKGVHAFLHSLLQAMVTRQLPFERSGPVTASPTLPESP